MICVLSDKMLERHKIQVTAGKRRSLSAAVLTSAAILMDAAMLLKSARSANHRLYVAVGHL